MRRLLVTAAVCLFLGGIAVGIAGEVLSRPARRAIGDAPPDLRAVSVRLPTSSSEFVAGWFIRGQPRSGVILLLHGVRADRTQMLERARFLNAAGYGVLLIDLQAHGESTGDRITFGAREGLGVAAALDFLHRELPDERVGVIGMSLGAASLVLSKPSRAPSAVVLESMYPTITEAVVHRLVERFGAIGSELAPLLLAQLPWRLGITADQLSPVAAVAALGAPVLIASGRQDQRTTWAETERIFAAAAHPKELWAVEGAAHVDLHAHDRAAYEPKVLQFLSKYLRDAS